MGPLCRAARRAGAREVTPLAASDSVGVAHHPGLTIDTIRAIVTPICRKHGVARADLFGSYARGEQTPASDIDIVIDEGTVRGLGFFRLQRELADSLGKRVDLQSLNGRSEAFLNAIEHDRMTIYFDQP